eukprot:UN18175
MNEVWCDGRAFGVYEAVILRGQFAQKWSIDLIEEHLEPIRRKNPNAKFHIVYTPGHFTVVEFLAKQLTTEAKRTVGDTVKVQYEDLHWCDAYD